jgi:hypothetical protein
MALFKSPEDRRIERELSIRKGINSIRRNIRDLERNEKEYLKKARRGLQMGSKDQVQFLKSALKRTAVQKRAMERQLLNIETALQIKNQAEAHAEFATAMNALSRSIGDMFGSTDFSRTQKDFEKAMMQAKTMEERADLFLEMSSQSLFGYEGSGEELVSDAEIDRMIEDEAVAEESKSELDQAIDQGLADVRKELGKE